MGQLLPLPSSHEDAARPQRPPALEAVQMPACDLCGERLSASRQSFRMVSPLTSAGTVVVCGTCRRAALGEGYRPTV
jgi:hypothetical protein